MSLTDPPNAVSSINTMLGLCASWPVGATTWYPSAADNQSGTFAVLSEDSHQRTRFAIGAEGIASGTIRVTLRGAYTIGALETLGRTLAYELSSLDGPLPIRSVTTELCNDPDPGDVAGGEERRAIELLIEYGLTP